MTTLSTTASTLGTGALKDAVQGTASGLILVQTYTKTITTQPIITGLDLIPNLGDHQTTAVGHANTWLSTCQPDIIQMQTDIGAFADGFNSYYQPLLDLANKIAAGGVDQPAYVTEFNEGLSELQAQVTTNRAHVKEITDDLNTFQAELSGDYQNFLGDYQTASTKILGDGGEVSQLNGQLTADQDAINQDNAMIAGGAVGAVVGGLMIAVGALAEIETAGVSTGLIVGGIAVVGGGGAMIGVATKDLIAKQNDYRDVSEQITTINNDIAALTTIKGQLDSFNTELDNAITAVSNVDKAWQTIGDSFNDLSTQLTTNIKTSSPFIVAEVTQAGSEWTDLKALIVQLETFHDIPTTPQTVEQATQTPPPQAQAA